MKFSRKQKAAFKIAKGLGQMAAGITTATGHGILGSLAGRHHNWLLAIRLGGMSIRSGMRSIDEGEAEWKRANSFWARLFRS